MSVGAICFTSSGSNGGCWVVLVFPRFFFFFGKNCFFFPMRDLRQKKKFLSKKNAAYSKKNKKSSYAYFHDRATLSSHAIATPVCVDGREEMYSDPVASWVVLSL